MPIKGSELPGHTPTALTVDERIPADLGHDKYDDWAEDDTERDPTPPNKRRSEMQKETRPKDGDGLSGFHGKVNTKGTKSQEYKVGFLLPEGD
jgi:hypothetical protein